MLDVLKNIRQTKEAETDLFSLKRPGHIPSLLMVQIRRFCCGREP
jgi:hypothetical protein